MPFNEHDEQLFEVDPSQTYLIPPISTDDAIPNPALLSFKIMLICADSRKKYLLTGIYYILRSWY